MAVIFEKNLTTELDGITVTLQLELDDHNVVAMTVNTNGQKINSAKATWKFQLEHKTLAFASVHSSGAQSACILACIGTNVGKTLLECLLGSKNLTEIRACLQGKAIASLASAVMCIAACLGVS
jgi:hypothetical protein